MACKELNGLRLGLMGLLGIEDEAEKTHEMKELGDDATRPGMIRSLLGSRTLNELCHFYNLTLVDLQERVSKMAMNHPQMPYHQALLILTKKVEQDLLNQVDGLKKLYLDLDEIHHYIHELYPAEEEEALP